MQIIIPMSGYGERFRKAGYKIPKPLIEVEGKSIIEHVVDLFPGEGNFIFICNKLHLDSTPMESILKNCCPSGRIIKIEPHKLGPVYAVSKAYDQIDDDEDTIVNYCDFSCFWNFKDYKNWLTSGKYDGSIPSYKGFHPHSLGKTNYAYIKEENNSLTEIQEKKPYTSNKMNEFASSGTYHFSKGAFIKKYFSLALEKGLSINNEYYCSLVYNLMVKDGLNIGIYELEHFMQWGTPEDLKEYKEWSSIFKKLCSLKSKEIYQNGSLLIPMAGHGSRFKKASYIAPKPLIKVGGKAMFLQATKTLPKYSKQIFICLKEHLQSESLKKEIENNFSNPNIVSINEVTNGQAITCMSAIEHLTENEPLTISACDHSVIYQGSKLNELLNKLNTDIIVWTKRGHPSAFKNPNMYGWVKSKDGLITEVKVKSPFDDLKNDPIIIGTFTFNSRSILKKCINSLIKREAMVNGEYYIDSCIEDAIKLGYTVKNFEVDHYLCWGTPNDLKTFNYWRSCFDKWKGHPYKIRNDLYFNE
tara:strand:+ start:1041 stop:2624 length:1584 start_codon:yes stop_codon:yes gene_type:complete